MKKIISIVLLSVFVLSVFSLSACKNSDSATNQPDNSETEENGSTDVNATDGMSLPKCLFVSDKNEVAPGETFNVIFRMADAKSFCSVSAEIDYDTEAVAFVKEKSFAEDGYHNIVNDSGEKILYNGYVMTTLDFESEDLITATFKVDEKAQSGSEVFFTLTIDSLEIGLDPSGSQTKPVESSYSPVQISVKIK